MGRRIEIFKLFGFPIRIDLTWLLILGLVTYSLAIGFFPANHPGLPQSAYWAMGFVAAMGLFVSILLHELSHALVARHYKIKIDGITLFIFGGVAEMKEESPSPKVEFLVAVMGPVASILIGFFLFKLSSWGEAQEWNRALVLILFYLGFMNGLLAIFNLIPAFPLDGGRIFRSVLWALKKNYLWATRVAARVGQGFAWVLIALGAYQFFRGSPFGGLWYVLIGFFLKRASSMSVQVVKIQEILEKIPLETLKTSHTLHFTPQDRLVDVLAALEGYTLHTQYPVMVEDHLVGFLSLAKVNALKDPHWENRLVKEFLQGDLALVTLRPHQNAWEAFQKMRQGNLSLIFIVDDQKRLEGWVTMESLLGPLKKLFPAPKTKDPKKG